MKSLTPVITIDGPCGVGKSVLSKQIAKKLHWFVLDSGIFYRTFALIALKYDIPMLEHELLKIFSLDLYYWCMEDQYNLIKLYKKNVPNIISEKTISYVSSKIAIFPKVRKELLTTQRIFKKKPGLIANGRDMGTVVFPKANLKLFLDGNLIVRAQRRFCELRKKGIQVNFNSLKLEMYQRDIQDIKRSISPLIPAKDAIMIDSTNMSFEEVFNISLKYIKINKILLSPI
ncbi:Cytidylate kinase [Buchnera aphidicola (Thelaxes suberi)]|uniref:(d)CMP kinase n=1 Tax=Buchnera aphidicola TaxID=9 RepID=UPI003463D20C